LSSNPCTSVSWIHRRILYPLLGVPLPVPRLVTPWDPALTLSSRAIRQRQRDERKLRQLLLLLLEHPNQTATTPKNQQQRQETLGRELFQAVYGRGVTPQQREDFLVRYGCTGWTDTILHYLVKTLGESRGMVEIGAGHGQWARALNDAYQQYHHGQLHKDYHLAMPSAGKQFDFVLAYDDQSNLPLNTHIYNQYTQPHHEYFGTVHKLQTGDDTHLQKVLKSWTCRGRVLLLVYPPPGPMANSVLQTYIQAAPLHNDTVVYVGEGRGGANADDAFFDTFTQNDGEWILIQELPVQTPPGDKGYEKLVVLQRRQTPSRIILE
jgi:hypothetical protein